MWLCNYAGLAIFLFQLGTILTNILDSFPPLLITLTIWFLGIKRSPHYFMARHQYRRRQWHPTPVLLPGKSHGRRSLVGCSPWGRWGSDTTEWLHFHFSLSCVGEGNATHSCSCLENPRDWGAWWAAVSGVAQSRTRLKRLSSSSSNSDTYLTKSERMNSYLFI